jgi:heterodisulfide reductase subunit D
MSHVEKYKKEIYRCIQCRSCYFAYSGEPDREGMGEHEGVLYEGIVDGCPAQHTFEWNAYANAGKMYIARGVLEGDLKLDEDGEEIRDLLMPCIVCGNCQIQCENKIPTVDIIEALRADLVEAGVPLLEKHEFLGSKAVEMSNPYNEPHEKRTDWLPFAEYRNNNAELGYFVGCTASYRQFKVSESTTHLMKKAGLNFSVITDEACCGSPLLRTGQLDRAQGLVERNFELFSQFKTVIFSCAGCYRTFKVDYPKVMGKPLPFEVKHTIEFFDEMMASGQLTIEQPYNKVATWHDPCHLGRHIVTDMEQEMLKESENWMMDQRKIKQAMAEWFAHPRNIIKQIPGLEFKEMYRTNENSYCCGAGGGVKAGYPDFAVDISVERIREAEATGADILLTTCSFCYYNLWDAVRKAESDIQVMDLFELLNELVPE